MHLQSLALLTGVTAAVAAETVTLFLPGFDSQNLEAKVLGSSGAQTTYLLNCAAGTDEDECGVPSNGITVAQGHSTITLEYGFDEVTVSENCKYDAKSASCSVSMNESGITSAFQTAVGMSEIPGAFMPVTVTGTGAASATTGASASVSTASSTGGSTLTTSASTSTNTASTSSGTNTADSSSSAAATSQTKTDNAAMPVITGNARWAAGGVAAALALAAI